MRPYADPVMSCTLLLLFHLLWIVLFDWYFTLFRLVRPRRDFIPLSVRSCVCIVGVTLLVTPLALRLKGHEWVAVVGGHDFSFVLYRDRKEYQSLSSLNSEKVADGEWFL